ncbi:MAG: hypothetical protein IT305_06170 [Chloroflexi bacterium]|nr:hypothetical protein [Chloroflexota bacterium]
MRVDRLERHASERLGMTVLAITPVPIGVQQAAGDQQPLTAQVWEVLTEWGFFWLVERRGVVELFRAASLHSRRGAAPERCPTPLAALRRFQSLHPDDREQDADDSLGSIEAGR